MLCSLSQRFLSSHWVSNQYRQIFGHSPFSGQLQKSAHKWNIWPIQGQSCVARPVKIDGCQAKMDGPSKWTVLWSGRIYIPKMDIFFILNFLNNSLRIAHFHGVVPLEGLLLWGPSTLTHFLKFYFSYTIEIISPKWRAFAGQMNHIYYAIGCILSSPLSYLYRDWQTFTYSVVGKYRCSTGIVLSVVLYLYMCSKSKIKQFTHHFCCFGFSFQNLPDGYFWRSVRLKLRLLLRNWSANQNFKKLTKAFLKKWKKLNEQNLKPKIWQIHKELILTPLSTSSNHLYFNILNKGVKISNSNYDFNGFNCNSTKNWESDFWCQRYFCLSSNENGDSCRIRYATVKF